jgi:MSHA pilin protein MshC
MTAVNRQAGFTLVELVTVIVLVALLTAVAGPRFFDNQPFRERGYVDELASSLRYSQRVAIASGCNVRLRITVAGYSAFQRTAQASCTTASGWTRPVLRSDGIAIAGAAPAGVAATPATFQFTNTGRLTVNNPPAITVGAFTLTVDPISGLVAVQ